MYPIKMLATETEKAIQHAVHWVDNLSKKEKNLMAAAAVITLVAIGVITLATHLHAGGGGAHGDIISMLTFFATLTALGIICFKIQQVRKHNRPRLDEEMHYMPHQYQPLSQVDPEKIKQELKPNKSTSSVGKESSD